MEEPNMIEEERRISQDSERYFGNKEKLIPHDKMVIQNLERSSEINTR